MFKLAPNLIDLHSSFILFEAFLILCFADLFATLEIKTSILLLVSPKIFTHDCNAFVCEDKINQYVYKYLQTLVIMKIQ